MAVVGGSGEAGLVGEFNANRAEKVPVMRWRKVHMITLGRFMMVSKDG